MDAADWWRVAPVILLLGLGTAGFLVGIAALVGWRVTRRERVWRRRVWAMSAVISAMGVFASVAGLRAIGFAVGWAEREPEVWVEEGSSAELRALLEKRGREFVRAGKAPGLVLAAARGDEACVMGFGRPALAAGAGVSGRTLFEIGSITKTFTGLMLAQAVGRGAVRLEERLEDLLPAEVELRGDAREVTLRQLTTHTAGLPRLAAAGREQAGRALGMLIFGTDPYRNFTEERYWQALGTMRLEHMPGQVLDYSNFGVAVLGAVLARQAGRDYEALLEEDICGPLGMGETGVRPDRQGRSELAAGYRWVWRAGPVMLGLRSQPWEAERNVEGAGGIRSSGEDMLRYLRANMEPGGTRLAEELKRAHGVLFRTKRGAIGMGWMISKTKRFPQVLVWHNGATGGYRSFIGWTGGSGVVALANGAESVDDLGCGLLEEMGKGKNGEGEPSAEP